MSTETNAEKRQLPRHEGKCTGSNTLDLDQNQSKLRKHEQNELSNSPGPNMPSSFRSRWPNETKEYDQDEDGCRERGLVIIRAKERGVPQNTHEDDGPRQVIAVSANKNPTVFFQLARKFLMTNDTCDLSALEGAILSAVDAAHLLERSQLACIVRIQTSYVRVEPKRRKQGSQHKQVEASSATGDFHSTGSETSSSNPILTIPDIDKASIVSNVTDADTTNTMVRKGMGLEGREKNTIQKGSSRSSPGDRELRRARILVTVRRTDSYKRWLEHNPLQRQGTITGEDSVESSTMELSSGEK